MGPSRASLGGEQPIPLGECVEYSPLRLFIKGEKSRTTSEAALKLLMNSVLEFGGVVRMHHSASGESRVWGSWVKWLASELYPGIRQVRL